MKNQRILSKQCDGRTMTGTQAILMCKNGKCPAVVQDGQNIIVVGHALTPQALKSYTKSGLVNMAANEIAVQIPLSLLETAISEMQATSAGR